MRRRRPERILVVVRGHLGDVVQAFPALRDIRRARPEAHITVMLNDYVSTAFEGCPYVDRVLTGFAYRRPGAGAAVVHAARLAASVAGRFDTVIALRWSPALTPLLALATGASVRVGYDRTGRLGKLLTHNLGPEPIDTVSNRVLNQRPLLALGIDSSPLYPVIDWVPATVRDETTAVLNSAGLPPAGRFALVQLSSHWGCGEWRSDKWAALCEHLAVRRGLEIVVSGTGEAFERDKFESVARRCRARLISLLGMTTLPQLFEVVRRAELAVAGDSGVAQVALAQRTPSVVMFGIEEIEANGPLPEEANSLMWTVQHWGPSSDVPAPNPHCAFGASHCHGRFCTEDFSRRSITVDEMITKVGEALRREVSVRRRAAL